MLYLGICWDGVSVPYLLLQLSLCSPVANRNGDRVLGEVEKSSFYCFAWEKGLQGANSLQTIWPTQEEVVNSFIMSREQSVISSWTVRDWLASRWSFKHHQPSGFNQSRVYVLVVSSFHLEGSPLSVKQLRNVCQAFLSSRELGVW